MVRRETAALAASRSETKRSTVAAVISGQSPERTRSEPSKSASASRHTATASAVPFLSGWTTISVSS